MIVPEFFYGVVIVSANILADDHAAVLQTIVAIASLDTIFDMPGIADSVIAAATKVISENFACGRVGEVIYAIVEADIGCNVT